MIAVANVPLTADLSDARAEWRAGFDAGVKAGVNRYLQSRVFEDLALELTMLRAAVTAMTAVANEREQRIEWLEGVLQFTGASS